MIKFDEHIFQLGWNKPPTSKKVGLEISQEAIVLLL